MKIAIIDIETTGRTPKTGTIVEIGICLLDLETQFKSKLFSSTCREANFESLFEGNQLEKAWIFLNSSLKIEEIKKGPTWEEIKPKIQKIVNKFPMTAYNKQFDLGFLKDRGIKITREADCPMIRATPVLKLPGYYEEYKWPNVQEAWNYFFPNKLDYTEEHRAYDDAYHEADIVFALYKLGALKI